MRQTCVIGLAVAGWLTTRKGIALLGTGGGEAEGLT